MQADLQKCTQADAVLALAYVVHGIFTEKVMPIARVDDPQRIGGAFAFWRKDPATDFVVRVCGFRVGDIPEERFAKYEFFADEKAQRLSEHGDDVSSWQSRNEAGKQYGGAIRVGPNLFFSFSGLPEHLDEMVCCLVAAQLGLLDSFATRTIIQASGNKALEGYLEQA